MQYHYTGGLLMSALIMVVLIALPIKLAASFADARRTGLLWCCGAVIVGLLAGHLASLLLGGYIGGSLAALLGFVLGIRLMLGTSFAAALGLSVIAFVLFVAGVVLLIKFGLFVSAPTPGGIAT